MRKGDGPLDGRRKQDGVRLVEIDTAGSIAEGDPVGRDDGASGIIHSEAAYIDRPGGTGLNRRLDAVSREHTPVHQHQRVGASVGVTQDKREERGVGAVDDRRAAVVDGGRDRGARHDAAAPVGAVVPEAAVGRPVVGDELVVIEEQAVVGRGEEEVRTQIEAVGAASRRPGQGEVGSRGHRVGAAEQGPGIRAAVDPQRGVVGVDTRSKEEPDGGVGRDGEVARKVHRRAEVGARSAGRVGEQRPVEGAARREIEIAFDPQRLRHAGIEGARNGDIGGGQEAATTEGTARGDHDGIARTDAATRQRERGVASVGAEDDGTGGIHLTAGGDKDAVVGRDGRGTGDDFTHIEEGSRVGDDQRVARRVASHEQNVGRAGSRERGRAAVVDEGVVIPRRCESVHPTRPVGPGSVIGRPVEGDKPVVVEEETVAADGEAEVGQAEAAADVGIRGVRPGEGEIRSGGQDAVRPPLDEGPRIRAATRPETVGRVHRGGEEKVEVRAVGHRQIAAEGDRRGEVRPGVVLGCGGESPEIGCVGAGEG